MDELFDTGPEREAAKAGHDASGHRSRLRKRLIEGGAEALADHEVIEYLLMTAIPRRDVKPLARTLITRFGSLAGVLNADPKALANHPGMGETSAAALRIVALAAGRMARQQVREKPVLSSWQALIDYLTIDMAHLTVERRTWFLQRWPMALGLAAFVDLAGAATSGRFVPASWGADAGIGLRWRLPGRHGNCRFDIAHGITDDASAFSFAWQGP